MHHLHCEMHSNVALHNAMVGESHIHLLHLIVQHAGIDHINIIGQVSSATMKCYG